MRRLCISVIAILSMISISGRVSAQSNSTGTIKWPQDPPVGIGAAEAGAGGPQNALHIHHDPGISSTTMPAILRFSRGSLTATDTFGILGLMLHDTSYSSLSTGLDLVMKQHAKGDLILTNFWPAGTLSHQSGGSVRLATAGDTSVLYLTNDSTLWRHDYERLTILPNGNIGIDMPPDSTTGLCIPLGQLQIGGGSKLPPYLFDAVPGLTIDGGNRDEGRLLRSGITPKIDWRYIALNEYTNHTDASDGRFHRIANMSTSVLAFAPASGGLAQFYLFPYDAARGKDDFTHGVDFSLSGEKGLEMWSDEPGNPYHHLYDVWRPGFGGSDSIRNINGLFLHHTPVYIGGQGAPNFTNLTNVHPNLGDDSTWMLAVNGAALFKEAFVNTVDWPDFVFEPDYKVMTIEDFGHFIETNHHLPELPAAKTMNVAIPLGKTESDLTKQVEEMALYIVQLHKEVEALKTQVQALNTGGK